MIELGRPLAIGVSLATGVPLAVGVRTVGRLLTLGLLATVPVGLYRFWVRHDEWTRDQRLYKSFALVTSASVLLVYGDAVGIGVPRTLELAVLGIGLASLALWAWFGAAVWRDRTA